MRRFAIPSSLEAYLEGEASVEEGADAAWLFGATNAVSPSGLTRGGFTWLSRESATPSGQARG